ncbi:MAG: N-acetylmuramoyl-L-alanine amidase [Bacillota bacterium]|nr:N-acetylmuramoyl-L-alanine amidase [Bacillota bacterium]
MGSRVNSSLQSRKGSMPGGNVRRTGQTGRTDRRKKGKTGMSKFEVYFTLAFLLFIIIGVTTRFGIGGDRLIVLDPGHGGSDPGAIYAEVNEKDINLAVAQKTAQLLKNEGYEVVMTREDDVFVELADRAAAANRYSDPVFVSIHCNASENPESFGIETYSARGSNKGRAFGKLIHNEVLESTGTDDRGMHERNFVVLRNTACPSVLVEIGFLSNEGERNRLTDNSYQNKIALGIAQGITNYIK